MIGLLILSATEAPFTPKTPLVFCPYNGRACCDSNQDLGLQKVFQAMNISDPACASLLKSILCAKCDQFSAELFKIELETRTVPVLCTVSSSSTLSKGAANEFCAKVWDTCQNVSILNSPFVPSLRGRATIPVSSSTSSKLIDLWQSKSGFCEAFGGSSDDGVVCFDGNSASLHNTETPRPPNGICLEQIANGSFLDMAAHPDGSNHVFLGSQQGKIWLATVPEGGSGEKMVIDESNPFVDLTDIVRFNTELGLMSIAFHPNFARNGRFFVSYNCDRLKWSGCSGKCSCNTDVSCDPSKLHPRKGALPCQYHSVISEFTANGTAAEPSLATRGNPSEVRRIFTMGLAYTNANGGQILFGPDGYLYFMTGDGEDENDTYNLAQNKKSLLGKILRFDIDNLPSAAEISNSDLWGNYSIPRDNPHSNDKELLPEIWASGFRNPWRCSFDSERPSYFFCADSGEDQYEEVNIVTKGGNYGWPFYEGTSPFHTLHSSGGNASMGFMNLIFPVMGYDHSLVNTNEGSSSVAGGFVYRSKIDPCLYGRYLFSDLYGFAIWAGTENPENSRNFTTAKLSFSCARNSPIQCSSEGSSQINLGYVFSMGTDNRKDVFLLTSKGVLRIVRPSRCNYTCSKEDLTAYQNPQRGPSPSTGSGLRNPQELLLLFSCILLLLILPCEIY
ncbi:Glucose/Sorbosone dehydrogenase [Macleaya cordata]|uniref:Glucose/Sorbosone dehydrogenase n=1 Tax=Macleaya cordata TaxID=56857 RepID=A0A200QY83_MACCD|nr:Glucose/Sorbosone dehydrogenase [Macleaya cordata]